jgi:Flp pilus assembly protein TadG
MQSCHPSPKSRRKRERGAAVVEFMVAAMPLLITFFSFVQVGKIMTAQLIVQHAANCAVRAATVVVNPDSNPGASGKASDVEMAAKGALGAFGKSITLSAAPSGGGSRNAPVNVTVTATYTCDVPLGKTIVCSGGSLQLKPVTATLPLQGADYKL